MSKFEKNGYKVRFNNRRHTVLKMDETNKFEPILEDRFIGTLDIDLLSQEIQHGLKDKAENYFFRNYMKSRKTQAIIYDLQNYKNVGAKVHVGYKKNCGKDQESGIYFDLEIYNGIIYSEKLTPDDNKFLGAIESAKQEIDNFLEKYNAIIDLVSKINNCKNCFWKAALTFNCHGVLRLEVDQVYIEPSEWHITKEHIDLSEGCPSSGKSLQNALEKKMKQVMKNMEKYGYRVMEVRQQ